ncbi:MAG: hypothetical protein HYX26_01940 [Acidobacteriales bacterium]|nr:hypothetical protein [Terriglobales bacterium]
MPSKPPSAVDVISSAIHTTQQLMFRPFRFSRWWRVAVIAIFTGELGGSGGFNFNIPDLSGLRRDRTGPQKFLPGADNPFSQFDATTWALIITVLVVGILTLLLVHIYIGSVMRFVQFDAVARQRFRLREGWRTWHRHGVRFFGFHLLFSLIAFLIIGLIAGVFLGAGFALSRGSGDTKSFGAFLALFLLMIPFVLVVAVVAQVLWVLAKDFALPIMALEPVTVREALGRVKHAVMSAKGDYAVYILMKIVLSIGSAIVVGIASFLLLIVVIVPLVIGGVFAGVAWPTLLTNPFMLALIITAAIVLLIVVSFALATVFSPIVIFFQSYVLHFYAPRYPLLQQLIPSPPPIVPLGPPPGTAPAF